ncbi:MAG: SUMF1/EgtB/PvdO family nonheme iron enzyme [Planctomycetes bacterium]|nr:SUMF1/EgtB/PvdO family nonheme iron enzyme [Planctomycetota bacterium]
MRVRSIPLGGAALAAAGGFVGLWYASQALRETEVASGRDSAQSRAAPAPTPTPDAALIEKLRREAERREVERREADRREQFGPDIGGLVPLGKSPQGLCEYDKALGGGVTLRLVLIPAGTFAISSLEREEGRNPDKGPVYQVSLKSFLIGKYEVTQRQWQAVMGSNPAHFKNTGHDAPVETVSWHDCQEFCEKANLRLPSEAEWKYACRAGTTARYSFGDDASALGEYAWYDANSGGTTHPVGQKRPNAWGLHDMHGNVWEYCEDDWSMSTGDWPPDGSARVLGSSFKMLRGCSWVEDATGVSAASRGQSEPVRRSIYDGFRVALSVSASGGSASESAGKWEVGETVELKDIVAVKQANLGALSRPRKIVMTVAVEVGMGPDGDEGINKVRLEKAKDLMRYAIREVLETYTYDDMVSPQFVITFKAHAKTKLNEQLGPNSVRRVFVTKFTR